MDQEVVALIASSLAYGRVKQILKSVRRVLSNMGLSPFDFIQSATSSHLTACFSHFKHRFTTGEELIQMIEGMKNVIQCYGSLFGCFCEGYRESHPDIRPALSFFVKKLSVPFNGHYNSLMPVPEKGSACKRLILFLRWMIRKDQVDPGGWHDIQPSKLIIPLDTHMHRLCIGLGFTKRQNPSMKTAMEITDAFREIEPSDPVRYDFALTRLGIRNDEDGDHLEPFWCNLMNSGYAV
jgi:uncharacterized protein (TIGR02757 family)